MGNELKRIKFNEFPDEVKMYFISRTVLLILFECCSLAYIFISKGFVLIYCVLAIFAIALVSLSIKFYDFSTGKYRYFEGSCVKIDKPVSDVKISFMKFTLYGRCNITIAIDDMQVELPCYSRFNCNEGDTVGFYCKEVDFFQSSEKLFHCDLPICLKLIKYGK